MIEDIIKTKSVLQDKIAFINNNIDLKHLSRLLEEIDGELNIPSIWDNPSKANKLSKERTEVADKINFITMVNNKLNEIKDSVELASDPEFAAIIYNDCNILLKSVEDFELKLLLKEKEDKFNAIITITAGSGGNESEDWASMLSRMYVMWASKNGFDISTESINETPSGLNDITYKISGTNAYGLLKNENGVHRLVRNSPFDANLARHTSFAAVEVIPDIDDSINVNINLNDCEVTAIRSSGAGGQNVNKVSSCIRLKHIPTGIQIVSRSSRDQSANKKAAFERLYSKLYSIELEKRNQKYEENSKNKSDASFGHQIRSYVLSGFQFVNDHRCEVKMLDTKDVLDGNIDPFIKGNLIKNIK